MCVCVCAGSSLLHPLGLYDHCCISVLHTLEQAFFFPGHVKALAYTTRNKKRRREKGDERFSTIIRRLRPIFHNSKRLILNNSLIIS